METNRNLKCISYILLSCNNLCGLTTDDIYLNSHIHLIIKKFVWHVTTICVKLVNLIPAWKRFGFTEFSEKTV